MNNRGYSTVNGYNLVSGWLADIHLVTDQGIRDQPVTLWLAAVAVVRKALGYEMYGSLDPQWRQLVQPHDGADRVPGQWLIPLGVRELQELVLDGVCWDREVSIYEDRYSIHIEIAR